MNLSKKPFFLLSLLSLLVYISCKKETINPFAQQEGAYIGLHNIQTNYAKTDCIPIAYDSITQQYTDCNIVLVSMESMDTTFTDTARIAISNDSILFYSDGIYEFMVTEENRYMTYFSSYSSITFNIKGDTLSIFDTYPIDRGSTYPGSRRKNFIGVKQK